MIAVPFARQSLPNRNLTIDLAGDWNFERSAI